jgi:PAT family beta-lactamase induction signal transducer AmpG
MSPQSPITGLQKQPWIYIPTLYYAEGLPYVIVNTVSVILYKKMGLPNRWIGLTSILYLPWVIKMFWGPVVDVFWTKRRWIYRAQLLLSLCFAAVALSISSPVFLTASMLIFVLTAFTSATHDIATDGYYMLALDKKKQAFFVGVRSTFYRLSMIFGSGFLVVIAGTIEKRYLDIPLSWTVVMIVAAGLFLVFFLFHRFYLPEVETARSNAAAGGRTPFLRIFTTYFRRKHITAIVAFILLYRLGEAVLVKMAPPFLLDSRDAGGLGLSTDTGGFVYGTVGVIGLTIGGLLGGWLISTYGLKKCIWPMALMLKAPDLVYVYMAVVKPDVGLVYILVALEQFGYGVGFTAFMVFLMYSAQGEYKTSHFAISTGLMALGMMLPGLVSGFIQEAVGYITFFTLVICLTIPGLIVLYFIPVEKDQK